jgi:hypothetical protein
MRKGPETNLHKFIKKNIMLIVCFLDDLLSAFLYHNIEILWQTGYTSGALKIILSFLNNYFSCMYEYCILEEGERELHGIRW